MTSLNLEKIQHDLENLIGEECKVVTYKWLARKYCLSANHAKRILLAFFEKHKERTNSVFMVSGWTKESKQHIVQLVPHDKLTAYKEKLEPITAIHIFSVSPRRTGSSSQLWSVDQEQTRELFGKLVLGANTEEVKCFKGKTYSAIKCKQVEIAELQKKPQQAQKDTDGKTIGEQTESKQASTLPPLSASTATKSGGKLKRSFKKSASKSVKTSKDSKTAKKEASPPPAVDANAAIQNDGGSDSDDSEEEIVVKRRSIKSVRMEIDDDDDDEDDDVDLGGEGENEALKSKAVEKDIDARQEPKSRSTQSAKRGGSQREGKANTAQKSGGRKSKAETSKDKAAQKNQGTKRKTDGLDETKASKKHKDTKSEGREESTSPKQDENDRKTDSRANTGALAQNPNVESQNPNSGTQRRKVLKTYYNDAGEEITEEVSEEVPLEERKMASENTQTPAVKKTEPPPPAKKASRGKGKNSRGQRSIASFFGKK